MISLFKKIRMKLFSEGKVSSYLLYALGEIILVTIGILIAVAINNWNEGRKDVARLNTIFETIERDLRTDSIELVRVISGYEKLNHKITNVLNGVYDKSYFDTINIANYKNCYACSGLNDRYEPFNPQTKGIDMLRGFNLNSQQEQDSITVKIVNFYSNRVHKLNSILAKVEEVTVENIKALEQYPWYLSYLKAVYNQEALNYFAYNQEYKNKLSTFQLLSIGNYVTMLQIDQKECNSILEEFLKR